MFFHYGGKKYKIQMSQKFAREGDVKQEDK